MRRHEDALESTSFLDLLSCSLVAVILLVVSSGAEQTVKLEPVASLRIGQDLEDEFNHLQVLQIGNLFWYSERTPTSGNVEQAYAPFLGHARLDIPVGNDVDVQCAEELRDMAPLEFEKVDGSKVFAAESGAAFAKAVAASYGVQVRVEPHLDKFPASAVISADEVSRPPEMYAYLELCTADKPHTSEWRGTVTTKRETAIAKGTFRYSRVSLNNDVVAPNISTQRAVFFCGTLSSGEGTFPAPLVRIPLTVSSGRRAIPDIQER